MAAEKKHDDPHKDQPPRPSDGPPAPRHTEHQQPVKDQSQKAEIAQYYKSQGKRLRTSYSPSAA